MTDWGKKFTPDSSTLEIRFESVTEAQVFKDWLCGAGEQDYWLWRDCRADYGEVQGGVKLDYHAEKNAVIVSNYDRE